MPIYIGYKCPICQEIFAKGDDVVVCPTCGTPHHRFCYKENGHCANHDGHSSGKEWQPPVVSDTQNPPYEQGVDSKVTMCSRCGSYNPHGSPRCQVCGDILENLSQKESAQKAQVSNQYTTIPFPITFAQIDLTEEIAQGVTAKEICDFVGPNSLSFLYEFKSIERLGERVSVNWCGMFGFFYCFYRKMYKLGIVYLSIFLTAFLPALFLTSQYIIETISLTGSINLNLPEVMTPAYLHLRIASMILFIVIMVLGLINVFSFNHFYMKQCLRSIHQIREHGHFSTGSHDYTFTLARRGGVNLNSVLLTISCFFLVNYLLSLILSVLNSLH